MKLHSLKKNSGYNKPKPRVGRGNASRLGNYSGKGHKGQKARSGYSRQPGFEGGQTPLHMRLPKKRGFKQFFKLVKDIQVCNIADLEKCDAITADMTVTPEVLIQQGLVRKAQYYKILGQGDLSKKINFADAVFLFSTSARKKIEEV